MTWAIVTAALLYLALVIVLWLAESRLVYFPGPQRSLIPPPALLDLATERVEFRTEDDVGLVGWVIPASSDSSGWWLLICHGNAGNLSEFDRPVHYAGLRRLGLSLLAFDYRGYGESGGVVSEQGLYRDADAAYRYLRQHRGVPADRIVVFGHSLGSAVAVELAGSAPAAGLILDGALTSVTERAQEIYRFVPVRWIAASRYASIDKIGALSLPKLFLHAEGDDIVPIAHGRRLFEAAQPPKQFVALKGGHGDAFEVDSAAYYGAVGRFVAELSGRASP